MRDGAKMPQAFAVAAADGYPIRGNLWRHAGARHDARPVVIVNPATSVHSRYYSRFAAFLFSQGFDVITYDYRGIGASRPPTLRGFHASYLDWGRFDFEAILRHAAQSFPGQPIQVAAHSGGGLVIGLAASNHLVQRVFTVGAQYAYWPDYARRQRLNMFVKWHVVMPLVTALCGYFPGSKLGWMEDTPRGVVQEWSRRAPRFEDSYRRGALALPAAERAALVGRFGTVTAPTLAVSVTDDPFGTVPAIERLLAYFTSSPTTHLRITPESIGETAIGHFAFFHSRFEQALWRIPLEWLKFGRVPADVAGMILPADARHAGRTNSGRRPLLSTAPRVDGCG